MIPPASDHDCLSIRRLTVSYGNRTVLHDVDLPDLRPYQIAVFAGPNGAGKSTVLRAIAGAAKASGQIMLGKTDLLSLSPSGRADLIGFLPQTTAALSRLSVLDSLVASLRLFGRFASTSAGRTKACATLERLGILDLAMASLGELSGGQRQLAVLAQSLVRDPHVLLLDEPTSALDPRHQVEVMAMLRSIAAEGRIIALVLHDLALAAKWADEFVFIRDGKVAATGAGGDVMTPAVIEQVFDVQALVQPLEAGGLTVTITGI